MILECNEEEYKYLKPLIYDESLHIWIETFPMVDLYIIHGNTETLLVLIELLKDRSD